MIATLRRAIKNPLLRNILTYAFTDGLSQAMPFLVLPVIAAYLEPEDFGRVTNYNVLVQVLTAFIGMRMVFYYSADFYKRTDEQKASLLSNMFYLMAVISILTVFILSWFHSYVTDALDLSYKWQLTAVLMVFFLSISQLYVTQLRLRERVGLFARVQFLRSLSSALLSLLFVAVLNWSWQGRIYGMFITATIVMLVSLIVFVRQRMLFSKVDFAMLKTLLYFGLPLLPYALAPWLMSSVQKIVITTEVSLAQNGIYSLALTLVAVFSMATTSFFSAYTPHLYKNLSKNEAGGIGLEVKFTLVRQSYIFMVVLAVLLLGGYWILFLVIKFFMPASYQEALIFLPLLMVGVFFSNIGTVFKSYIIFSKKTGIFGTATFLVAVVQTFTTYWFIINFGTMGAVYANLISELAIAIIGIALGHYYYPMPWLKFRRIVKQG